MDKYEWFRLVLAFIGGIFAVLIGIWYKHRQNRVQPIRQETEILKVFDNTLGSSRLRAEVSVKEGRKEYKYRNLFIARLTIVNKGSVDYENFKFGATLSSPDQVIFIEPKERDRHHIIEQREIVVPSNPKSEIDFILRPFNRNNSYGMDLYIIIGEGRNEPGEIKLSSPHPIRFITTFTGREFAEMLGGISIDLLSINLGPIRMHRR